MRRREFLGFVSGLAASVVGYGCAKKPEKQKGVLANQGTPHSDKTDMDEINRSFGERKRELLRQHVWKRMRREDVQLRWSEPQWDRSKGMSVLTSWASMPCHGGQVSVHCSFSLIELEMNREHIDGLIDLRILNATCEVSDHIAECSNEDHAFA